MAEVIREVIRYDELRSKTDRQLVRLVSEAVALGLREASYALTFADTWIFAEGPYRSAKRAYAEASRMLLLTGEITKQERRGCEGSLRQLQEMIDGLSVLSSARAADGVPTLARALWEARGCPEGSPEDDWFRAERVLQSQLACVAG
jgi:hypothetical protein